MWPVAARVDDDEVDVGAALDRLAHLPADLADGEDLLHARRRVRDEVERLARAGRARPSTGTRRLSLQVLLQRRLGVHRHREDPGIDLARLEADRALLELRGDVALGVDLDEQDALADVRREQRGRGGDRALADAALAREEEAGAGRAGRARARSRAPLPAAEADLAISGIAGDLDERELVGGDADLAGPSCR